MLAGAADLLVCWVWRCVIVVMSDTQDAQAARRHVYLTLVQYIGSRLVLIVTALDSSINLSGYVPVACAMVPVVIVVLECNSEHVNVVLLRH